VLTAYPFVVVGSDDGYDLIVNVHRLPYLRL